MPDSKGLLSQDERSRIGAAMKGKFPHVACPWCGSPNWDVGPGVVTTAAAGPGGAVSLGGQFVPQVTLVSPCGYIASFALKLIGVNI